MDVVTPAQRRAVLTDAIAFMEQRGLMEADRIAIELMHAELRTLWHHGHDWDDCPTSCKCPAHLESRPCCADGIDHQPPADPPRCTSRLHSTAAGSVECYHPAGHAGDHHTRPGQYPEGDYYWSGGQAYLDTRTSTITPVT